MWDDSVYTTTGTYIQAIQWTGSNFSQIIKFVQSVADYPYVDKRGEELRIFGPENISTLLPGDWLLRTLQGQLLSCSAALFPIVFTTTQKAG